MISSVICFFSRLRISAPVGNIYNANVKIYLMVHEVHEWISILQTEFEEYFQDFLQWLTSHASFVETVILLVALIESILVFIVLMKRQWVRDQLKAHTGVEKVFIISFFSMVISGICLLVMGVGLIALTSAGLFSLSGLVGTGVNALFFIVSLIACLFSFLLLFAYLFIGREPTQPQIFDEVNWGGTPMLVIIIAYFIISVIVTLFSSTAGVYAGSLAFIILPLYLVIKTYNRPKGTMGFRTPSVKWFLILLPVIPFLLLLNELVYEITERILGQFPLEDILEEIITENPILMSINTGVVGPIGEEVFFRGFVYTGLRRKYGVRNGILLSSLFFGVTHGIPWQIPYAFVAGIILAAVYEKTGSLYSPILIHIINNSLAVIGIIS